MINRPFKCGMPPLARPSPPLPLYALLNTPDGTILLKIPSSMLRVAENENSAMTTWWLAAERQRCPGHREGLIFGRATNKLVCGLYPPTALRSFCRRNRCESDGIPRTTSKAPPPSTAGMGTLRPSRPARKAAVRLDQARRTTTNRQNKDHATRSTTHLCGAPWHRSLWKCHYLP